MAGPNPNLPVCPNGHQQPAAGTKFCIYCGVPIVYAAAAPVPPANVAPAPQFQPVPAVPVPNYNQNYVPQPGQQYFVPPAPVFCRKCGGSGEGLPERSVICSECNWLRPLVPGYAIDNSAFAWAADAKAMAALKAIRPLNAAAKAVSEKVGRRWVEVSFNGIALGEKQMPQIFAQAVRAARLLGMSHLPDIYLSGDRPWDCLTFGSDKDSFVVIGSAVAGNFQGVDMLYLLAREMGHCKAGHALWKTVIRFFLGEQGPAKGFMAGGIFNALMSPTAMIGGAIEMPLLGWARQAEITADRAGLIAVGSEHVARRTLLSLSLKSSFIFKQINIEAWLEQQLEDDGQLLRLSELTTSSTPYLGPRLKLLTQYAESREFQGTVAYIKSLLAQVAPPKPANAPQPAPAAPAAAQPAAAAKPAADIRIKCSACKTPMLVPKAAFDGKAKLSARCPNAKCRKVNTISRKTKHTGSTAPRVDPRKEDQNYAD